ncbi:MAG: molybdopterin molybdotransferase MoeA [Haloarculaceae archaeon]
MSSDRDEPSPREPAVDAVLDLREGALAGAATREVSITDAFEGAVLAEDVVPEADVPARTIATMDGFAIDATREYPLTVVDEAFPEDDPPAMAPEEAVRVATGAPIPAGANAVCKVEETTVRNDQLEGPDLSPGTFVYERGSNVAAGEVLFEAGETLAPRDAILLRDLGRERVTVREPFDVGLLATGTEIHEGRSADLDSPMLASLVRAWGHHGTIEGSVPDEYDRVEDAIARVAADRDVVLTTGGTSVGEKDHVVRALDALGEVHVHRVRLRPGKPIAVATLAEQDAVVFAIPGKPVGAHAVTTLVARPFFTGDRQIPRVSATAGDSVGVPVEGFEYAIPVTLSDGTAAPLGKQGSALAVYDETFDPSVLSSSTRATRADGFVLTESDFVEGERIDVVPYRVLE